MKVVKMSQEGNVAIASVVREMADRIASEERMVTGVAVTVTYASGDAGSIYVGQQELALVGALEVTKTRIMDAWPE